MVDGIERGGHVPHAHGGECDVGEGGHVREEVELLEDHAGLAADVVRHFDGGLYTS